uniref:Putative NAD-dependent formate dehydrogenase n=1 Tax=Moniliophthora roreri TaxID=221103 RepID=A0A0W0GCT0_MONRR
MKVLAILYNGFKAAQQELRLLGTVENKACCSLDDHYLRTQIHWIHIVSSSKEGPDSDLQKHIEDAEVLITTLFHPSYLTQDLIQKAKNLKICITAGVGSDHINLDAAVNHNIQFATLCQLMKEA